MPIYLDNAATTQPDPRAVEAMLGIFRGEYGNASSIHPWGVRAATAVEKARQILLKAMNGAHGGITFTSGGTEANNLALLGLARGPRGGGTRRRILVSAIEHPSVMEAARQLGREGFALDLIPVDREGVVDLAWLEDHLADDVLLVSVMHASHEVGSIQPIRSVGALCRARGALLHVDAAQAFTKVDLDVEEDAVDMVSLNGHKLHGPTGVGALWVREGIPLQPLLQGGGHEGGLRPGTTHTAGIVGFATAVSVSTAQDRAHLTALRDRFFTRVLAEVEGSRRHGAAHRLPSNANIGVEGVAGKRLFVELARRGVLCSTGSACSAGSLAPSRILLAMGWPPERAHEALRVSFGRFNTLEEVDTAVEALSQVVDRVRRES